MNLRQLRMILIGGLVTSVRLLSPAGSPAKVQRTLWRGQWVNYVKQGDYAVTGGDIIIGQKDAVAQARSANESTLADPGRSSAKVLTVDSAAGLWTRAAASIAETPRVVEAGNRTTISAAITEINRVLRWVPVPGPQTDYVHARDCACTPTGSAQCRMAWARLAKRVFDIDVERCRHCGGRLKLVEAIEETASQRRKGAHWLFSAPLHVKFAVSVVAPLSRSDRIAAP